MVTHISPERIYDSVPFRYDAPSADSLIPNYKDFRWTTVNPGEFSIDNAGAGGDAIGSPLSGSGAVTKAAIFKSHALTISNDGSFKPEWYGSLERQVEQASAVARTQYQELAAAVRAVAFAVNEQARRLDGLEANRPSEAEQFQPLDLRVGLSDADLTNALNYYADEELKVPELAHVSTQALLNSPNPALRAAAARALAIADPDRAKSLLPIAIKEERGRFASSIMQAVLRSLDL